MAGVVPKKVVVYTDQHTKNLHTDVATSLGQVVGHPLTAAEVNPDDASPLHKIKEVFKDAAHLVDVTGPILGGEGPTTYVGTTPSSKLISFAVKRARQVKAFLWKSHKQQVE